MTTHVFLTKLFTEPLYFISAAFVIVFSICLHEYFHARTALYFGDTTAADQGHLTLNPLKQMGVTSILMFLLMGFAWGCVPVNRAFLRARSKWADPLVSLAGPAANLLLFASSFLLFGFLQPRMYLLLQSELVGTAVLTVIFLMGMDNAFLFVFNLLPVPGLDGWNALSSLFPRMNYVSSEVVKGAMILLIFGVLALSKYIWLGAGLVMMYAPALLSGGAA